MPDIFDLNISLELLRSHVSSIFTIQYIVILVIEGVADQLVLRFEDDCLFVSKM